MPLNPKHVNFIKIFLDNGYGLEIPGKRSPYGLFLEYTYTREIAYNHQRIYS